MLVRLQFFAAVGTFHLAANSISIDCRVSGRILKKYRVRIFAGDFFGPFLELKVDLRMREFLHSLYYEHTLAHS